MLSYWERKQIEENADCVIVGGGITGLCAAIYLHKKQPKKKIWIVEQEVIGNRATTKNAGFACLGSPSEVLSNIELYGEDSVVKLIEMRWKGLERLFSYASKKQIAFRDLGGYECFDNNTPIFTKTVDKLTYLNSILKDVTGVYPFYEEREDLLKTFGLEHGFGNLIRINKEHQLNSFLLVRELEKRAIMQGANILRGVLVSNLAPNNNGIDLHCSNGMNIKCKGVILCTNALSDKLLGTSYITPGRGLVLITSPLKKAQLKGNFHSDEGYIYFRNVENRILIGGGRNLDFEGETTTEYGVNPKLKKYIMKYLSDKIAPNEQLSIDYEWSGIMAFTQNHQPIIKKHESGAIMAFGLNGMGVAIGAEVAKQSVELMLKG